MVVLEGPRVRLRPVERTDHGRLYDWYQDPELVAPFDRFWNDSAESFARSIDEAPRDPASLAPRWVVEGRDGGAVVGVVGHYRAHPVLEYIDVWYVMGDPRARGKGFGTEAVGLVVDHLFRTESVERVGATCDVENLPSARLLEKLGFRREGTLRSALFHHSRWHDVHVFGITRAGRSGPSAPG